MAPWLRVSPEGVGELFFAVANHGVAERSIVGAETADGMPSKPGAAIALPAHRTVFVEPDGATIRLAVAPPVPFAPDASAPAPGVRL